MRKVAQLHLPPALNRQLWSSPFLLRLKPIIHVSRLKALFKNGLQPVVSVHGIVAFDESRVDGFKMASQNG